MDTPQGNTEQLDEILKKLIVAAHDQASDDSAMRPDQVLHFTNYREMFAVAQTALLAWNKATVEQARIEAEIYGRINEHHVIGHDLLSRRDLENLDTATIRRLKERHMKLKALNKQGERP